MPPKKKDSKKSVKPAPSEDPSQAIDKTILPIQKQSIPRKPIYKTIRCDSESKALRMRAKLWKASSFHLIEPRCWIGGEQNIRKKESIRNLMASKTSKKALKNLRELHISSENYDLNPYKFLTRTLRLDKLQLTISWNSSTLLKMLRFSINQNLKSLIIPHEHWSGCGKSLIENIADLLSRFKNLQSLFLDPSFMNDYTYTSQFQKISFPFPKLRRLKKLNSGACARLQQYTPQTLRSYKKLQNFSFSRLVPLSDDILRSIPSPDIRDLTLSTEESSLPFITFASKFPNLESLSLSFSSTEEILLSLTTLSSRCPNLESLSLSSSTKIQLHDFSFFSHLKTLSLSNSKFAHSSVSIENLPKLESLQIGSRISHSFDSTFCKDLASKSSNLKTLSLETEGQFLNEFLQDNSFDFSLEKLTLKCHKITAPFTALSKNLSAFIKRNPNLRELELEIRESFHDFLEPVMKSIKSLTGLETFRFKLGSPIELQDHKIPLLKDVILKVKSARLDFPGHYFDSKEVSSLANALIKHEKLEDFALYVHFSKIISDAALNKFIEFVRNANRIKHLNLGISGFPEEKEVELGSAVGYDISFWERDGRKIS